MNLVRRKVFRAGKYLTAGFLVYFVSWIASVAEWSGGEGARDGDAYTLQETHMSTMRTIVAYSDRKQAEMDRPNPVTCDNLPRFPKVPYLNRTWTGREQDTADGWQTVPGTDVSLYAAYYDTRLPAQPYVRILASFRGRRWRDRPQLYCQTRPIDRTEMSVEVVAAKVLEIWKNEWDARSQSVETPLLLSCSLTERLADASVVSVVRQPCHDPVNAFRLEPTAGAVRRRNFTVCVKDMKFGGEKAQSVVEWIEVNKILGAEMIDIYVDRIGRELRSVLEHYRREGTVRLFKVPVGHNGRSLWQRRRDHIVTYNDCLYRNIKESKFILPIDVDEVVLPKVALDWDELILRMQALDWNPNLHSSILVQNAFFFDFMQGRYEYKDESNNTSSRRLYTKRDNVRLDEINDISNVNEDSHRVVGNSKDSVVKTVIYDKVVEVEEEQYRDMYRSRCGSEMTTPTVLRHDMRSAVVSPAGHFSKSLMLTRRVLTAFNHYPLDSLGGAVFGGWPAPFHEVQVNHYKTECNSSLVDCAQYSRSRRVDRAAVRLRDALLRALAASAPCPAPAGNYTHRERIKI